MRKIFILTLFVLVTFPLSSVDFLFEDYFLGTKKCLQAFNEKYREDCMWGGVETLKSALNQIFNKPLTVFYAGFFRNEGNKILSVNDPFSVNKKGEYFLTILNGNPSEKKGQVKIIKLVISSEKTKPETVFYETNFQNLNKTSLKIELDKGINYFLCPELIEPVSTYITVLISDKPIE